MTEYKKAIAVLILVFAVSGFAKDWYSAQSEAGISLKCTEDLTLSARGAVHGGHQIEQADDFYYKPFKTSGFTMWEGAAGFNVLIGQAGKVEVTGGAEMFMRTRKYNDTADAEYHEFSPTLLVGLKLPLAGGAKVELLNRMERRNFRAPNSPVTHLRYFPRLQFTSMEFTPLKFSGFCYYEGAAQSPKPPLSGWGAGINLYPVKSLKVQGAFTTLWRPALKNTVVHQVELNLQYAIDLTE
jgi:hypothetical protein